MELSRNLLRSVAVGIGLGLTAASCSILEVENEPNFCTDECSQECDGKECQKAAEEGQTPLPDDYLCLACGMG